MMTKAEWIKRFNEIVTGPRGEFARENGLEAYLMDGKVRYRAHPRGYFIRLQFAETIKYLDGRDFQALRAAR